MKSLKINFGQLAFIAIFTLALGFTACEKDTTITEISKVENPDSEKVGQGEDKPNEKMDTISAANMMPLQEENKLEKMPDEMRDKLQLRSQGRVKVIVTLKSIQCTNVSDGRINSNNAEELYGSINASVCARIAPNSQCQTGTTLNFEESRGYQRTQNRMLSRLLFLVDRPSYISFPAYKILYTNSVNVFDYDFASAYYPNLKLTEGLYENDFDGWRDGDDNYYFIGGTPTIYLAGLSFNTVHIYQSQFGDSSSRYTATYSIQKIYY